MGKSPSPNGEPRSSGSLTGTRKWLAQIILLVVSLAIALLLCEVAVRLFAEPFIMPRWVENAPYGIRKPIANIRGFIVTPHYRHGMSTNSKGFRGTREYAIPKPPDVFRIVVLGDSVVNGFGVEDEQTFSAVLEKMLSSQRPTEVLNLGVAGFGNAEELVQLENVGLEQQPDMVVLGYFVNDHFENLTSDLYRLEEGKLVRNARVNEPAVLLRDGVSTIPGYNFLCQHSYFVNFVRQRASGFFRNKMAQKHRLGTDAYTSAQPSETEIALTSALVDELIRVCHERQIPILILNLPMEIEGAWMQNLVSDRLTRQDQTRIVQVAEEIWNTKEIRDIATPGTYHPNAHGHQLIAEWLADYVQNEVWMRATRGAASGDAPGQVGAQ